MYTLPSLAALLAANGMPAALRVERRGGRCTAQFEGIELKVGPLLMGAYGDGSTEDAARRDYLRQLSGAHLVYHAHGADRRELRLPVFPD